MDSGKELVHLARLIVSQQFDDAALLVRRAMRGITKERPDLLHEANAVLARLASTQATRSNAKSQPLPVDVDSRLELLRREPSIPLETDLVWPPSVTQELQATVSERRKADDLLDAGLLPTRSLLFVGAPGVGKTLAARWLATQLDRPLLTLDLAAVMSSFLGRTGGNIRVVLDYARKFPCVLLLDEFDAIAKRRDDSSEIGELKRLVTVLLQEVDNWPADGLLIAATNHPELLDPAVWRRFDRVVEFPLPSYPELKHTIELLIGADAVGNEQALIVPLALSLIGKSFAEVTRQINTARRSAVVEGQPLQVVLQELLGEHLKNLDRLRRGEVAVALSNLGFTQRHIASLTGVARDTIRRRTKLAREQPSHPQKDGK